MKRCVSTRQTVSRTKAVSIFFESPKWSHSEKTFYWICGGPSRWSQRACDLCDCPPTYVCFSWAPSWLCKGFLVENYTGVLKTESDRFDLSGKFELRLYKMVSILMDKCMIKWPLQMHFGFHHLRYELRFILLHPNVRFTFSVTDMKRRANEAASFPGLAMTALQSTKPKFYHSYMINVKLVSVPFVFAVIWSHFIFADLTFG